MMEIFQALAIGMFVPLLISFVLLAWTIIGLRKIIAALLFRIEMIEHPERFPPQHPNCRSGPTYWGRDLTKHPLRAKSRRA